MKTREDEIGKIRREWIKEFPVTVVELIEEESGSVLKRHEKNYSGGVL